MYLSEYIDIFDENYNLKGKATREKAHQMGLWHHTFHCWIIIKMEGKRYLLFQRRHPNKDTFPNLLDISAAGHLLTGEEVQDGVREVKEELGLSIQYRDLHPVGVIKEKMTSRSLLDNEHCNVFLYLSNQSLGEFQLQEDEVSGLLKIEIDDVKALIKGKREKVKANGFEMKSGFRKGVNLSIAREHLVPHKQDYYIKVCEVAMSI